MARKPGKGERVKGERAKAGAKNPDVAEPQQAQAQAGGVSPGQLSEDRIRRRAYQIWEEEGWPQGRDAEHWSRAEREIVQGAGPSPEAAAEEDRSRAVAPPKSGSRPGASAKLGGAPSAPAAGKGRGK